LGSRFAQSFCGAAKRTDSILSKTAATLGRALAKTFAISRSARGVSSLQIVSATAQRLADLPLRAAKLADALGLTKG
jgi:hypothetical protein